MDITLTRKDIVEIDYVVNDDKYIYMDAIYFSQKEYENLKQEEIDKLIDTAYYIWKAYITAPIPEITKADKETELIRLQKEKTTIETKIAVLTADIAKNHG